MRMGKTSIPSKFNASNFTPNKEVVEYIVQKLNNNQNLVAGWYFDCWENEGQTLTAISEFHKRYQGSFRLRYIKGQDVDYVFKDISEVLIINEAYNDGFEDFLSIEKRRILEYLISYRIENELPIIILGYVENGTCTVQLSRRILKILSIEMK